MSSLTSKWSSVSVCIIQPSCQYFAQLVNLHHPCSWKHPIHSLVLIFLSPIYLFYLYSRYSCDNVYIHLFLHLSYLLQPLPLFFPLLLDINPSSVLSTSWLNELDHGHLTNLFCDTPRPCV